jgi:CheY-like chemotaxis protein
VEILKDLRIKILDVGHFSLPAQTRQGLSSQEGRQFALWKEEGFWSDEVGLHLKKQGWEMRSRDKISPDTWIFAAVPLGRDVQKWFREEDFPPFYRRIVLLTKQPQSFELGPRIYCFSLPFVGKDLRSFIHKIEEGPYASIQPRPVEEKGSILLVDDNQLNRNYFSSLLETRGYSVTEAESGSQAQKYLQEGRGFDYLFLDIQMPVMNGFAFLEWLRKAQPGFAGKIVALTADQSFEVQSRIHQEDFDHILAKPLFPGDLDDVFGQSSSALPVETQGFISQFPYRRGVRWQEGLERCNFNEVLYLGLLKKFCQDFSLEDALKVGLAPAIESKRLLHNLQSNAGILGLVDLRDLSRRLEQQIVQDKPGLEDLLDQWSVEFVSIYRLLKSLALQRTEETPGTLSFEQFLPLVQKKDPRAKKVWQQNSQGWKGLLGTDNWNSLGKAILNYNFKRAMELLEIPHEK